MIWTWHEVVEFTLILLVYHHSHPHKCETDMIPILYFCRLKMKETECYKICNESEWYNTTQQHRDAKNESGWCGFKVLFETEYPFPLKDVFETAIDVYF